MAPDQRRHAHARTHTHSGEQPALIRSLQVSFHFLPCYWILSHDRAVEVGTLDGLSLGRVIHLSDSTIYTADDQIKKKAATQIY